MMQAHGGRLHGSMAALVLVVAPLVAQEESAPAAPAERTIGEALCALTTTHGKNLIFLSDQEELASPIATDVAGLSWEEGLHRCLAASGLVAVEEAGGVTRIAAAGEGGADGDAEQEENAAPAAAIRAAPGEEEMSQWPRQRTRIRSALSLIASPDCDIVLPASLHELDQQVTTVFRHVRDVDAMAALIRAAGLTPVLHGTVMRPARADQLEIEERRWRDLPSFGAEPRRRAYLAHMITSGEGEYGEVFPARWMLDTLVAYCCLHEGVVVEVSDGQTSRSLDAKGWQGLEDPALAKLQDAQARGEPLPDTPGIPPQAFDLVGVDLGFWNAPMQDALPALARSVGLLATWDGKTLRVFPPP